MPVCESPSGFADVSSDKCFYSLDNNTNKLYLYIHTKKQIKIKIKDLDEYDSFNMLRKINNFLKHNSVTAYEKLKKYYPDVVASVENKTSDIPYENAMFAADWLIIPHDYIEDTIEKLRKFFKREMDQNYIPTINTNIPIKEQNLKRKPKFSAFFFNKQIICIICVCADIFLRSIGQK